jgi:biotin synthase
MDREELVGWLRETDAAKLKKLWAAADAARHENVGDAVLLRGLIEFSNCCVRRCAYCGLSVGNHKINRYRMTPEEILDCARQARDFGYGTVVLQSGEDRGFSLELLRQVIAGIKKETSLAVTLSVGERDERELAAWREAGADRYLLRFETSNPDLYARIHPDLPGKVSDRLELLRKLRALGYEVGSGVMIGIPGQTYTDLANDILLFAELDLDMIGVGPFLAHPDTPLGESTFSAPEGEQMPNSELMTYKVVALARLACPMANIPSTTALATVNQATGRELGLMRGANVVMPNVTPIKYRKEYQIYPGKACLMEDASSCHFCMRGRIESLGRTIGTGRGDSPNRLKRQNEQKVGANGTAY